MPRVAHAAVVASVLAAGTACSAAEPPIQAPPAAQPAAAAARPLAEPTPPPDAAAPAQPPPSSVAQPEHVPPPAPAPPELTVEDTERSALGALYFATYYLKVLEHTRNTNDPSLLWSASAASCEGCASWAALLEDDARLQWRAEGFTALLRGSTLEHLDEQAGVADVTLTYGWPAWRLVAGDGSVVEDLPAGEADDLFLRLHWSDGRWRVDELWD